MSRWYASVGAIIGIAVMGLAVYSVPFPGSLVLVAAVIAGAAIAVITIRTGRGTRNE